MSLLSLPENFLDSRFSIKTGPFEASFLVCLVLKLETQISGTSNRCRQLKPIPNKSADTLISGLHFDLTFCGFNLVGWKYEVEFSEVT